MSLVEVPFPNDKVTGTLPDDSVPMNINWENCIVSTTMKKQIIEYSYMQKTIIFR